MEDRITNSILDLSNYMLDKVTPILFENLEQSSRDREELKIKEELLWSLQAEADTLEEIDPEVRFWARQIREVAADAGDFLDEFKILRSHDHGDGIASDLFHKMLCCIKNMKARHRMTKGIPDIKSRIIYVSDRYKELILRKYGEVSEQGSSSSRGGSGNRWRVDRRADALLLEQSDLEGIEESINKLTSWLVNGSLERVVVTVAGAGGIGKTALAKQVFDDPRVKLHFPEISVWITASRFYNLDDFLREIIEQVCKARNQPVPEGIDKMDGDELKSIIKQLLVNKRYLIVFDDINDWDAIRYSFPNKNHGSRVMLTTRNADLSQTSNSEYDHEMSKIYNLKPLSFERSWILFCRRTFPGRPCPQHLEDICRNILIKCEGLPLAIVEVSDFLGRTEEHRIDQWEIFKNNLGVEIVYNDKFLNLKRALLLNFIDLPYNLKCCFLSLSIFPEQQPIEYNRLIRLWIANEYVETKYGKESEDVAEGYFNEFLGRNLLQVVERRTDGRVKSCRIPVLLHEIIHSKSRNSNFAFVAKEQNNEKWPADRIQHLSVHHKLPKVQDNRFSSRLRSLFLFGVQDESPIHKLCPNGFRLLNVFDVEGSDVERFPIQLMNSCLLKYLNFKKTDLSSIPGYIGKLQKLQTLNLKHTRVKQLPDEVPKLQQLRNLLVYGYENDESYANFNSVHGFKALEKIGDLQSLRILCFVEVNQENSNLLMNQLRKLKLLRRLGILNLRRQDGNELCSCIEVLSDLRSLNLRSATEDEILDLQHQISPPRLLQRLYLAGRLETLPPWICNLASLVRLHLKWSQLRDDPLPPLGLLPLLVHLELLEAYDAGTLLFRIGSFMKLKFLKIDKFAGLTCIEVEHGAMPYLEKLCIRRCEMLEKVPSGIGHLKELKELLLVDMPDDFTNKLRFGNGEDYCRVKHIPEVYYVNWRNGEADIDPLKNSQAFVQSRPTITIKQFFSHWK